MLDQATARFKGQGGMTAVNHGQNPCSDGLFRNPHPDEGLPQQLRWVFTTACQGINTASADSCRWGCEVCCAR